MKKYLVAAVLMGLVSGTCQAEDTQYRFLACMSSFNRPVFVSGQVLRLLRQSYPVDISVSVKGVPEEFVRAALMKEWEPEIQSGRLRIRIDENRDQYSNLLDTVRNVDLEQYDYFCKIDDDDWYGPDYFAHINEWLNYAEQPPTISYTMDNMVIRPGDKGVSVTQNVDELYGPSMCFSRDLIKLALELENDPQRADEIVPDIPLSIYRHSNEDTFLERLAGTVGTRQERHPSVWDLAFGWQYKSVMRD